MFERGSLLEHEALLRLGGFLLVLVVLVVAERLWPARGDGRPARRQWSNMLLVAIDTLLLRLVFPLIAVALAIGVYARSGGLFGATSWPSWLEFTLAILAFDLLVYWQHRMLHILRWLWPMHRVHHSDIAFDVSTGVRFHPLEAVLSMGLKLGLVWLLGPHPVAVLVFAILLSAASLFTHADFAFPLSVDRVLRWFVVTPSMHRTHHSIRREETDSNYGFLLSLWDRVFGSYRARSIDPERSMLIGVSEWRDARALGIAALLVQPFRRASTSKPGGKSHA